MIFIDAKKKREEAEKKREALDGDACMLCDAYGNDKRNWYSSCFYAIDESVPEALDLEKGFYLRICKSCRGRYLQLLREWRDECVSLRGQPKDHDGYLETETIEPERNIPYRKNGTLVMLTEQEWNEERNKTL